jgi:hypothetical protein
MGQLLLLEQLAVNAKSDEAIVNVPTQAKTGA